LLFNFALDDATGKIQNSLDVLELNGTHCILVCADYVNIPDGNINIIKENKLCYRLVGKLF
jgi:hypothetical protein